MKYYNIAPRLDGNPYDLDYFIAISGRGPGKSYSFAKFLIEHHKETGKKFLRIVRNNRFVRDTGTYFDNWKLENEIDFDGRYFYMHNREFGQVRALTDSQILRSGVWTEYDIIFFEEFCVINPDDYLVNETVLFEDIISTVNRNRNDLLVVLIGNNNNRMANYNPYFELLGVNWDLLGLKQGQFAVVESISNGARVGIERPAMAYESLEEIPRILRVPNNEIATSGEYERDIKTLDNVETFRKELAYSWQFKLSEKFYITIYNKSSKGFLYIKGSKSEMSRVHCADLTIPNNEKQIRRFLTFVEKISAQLNEKNLLLRYSSERTHYQFVIAQKNYLQMEKTIS